MIYSIQRIIICLLVIPLLSGCWGRSEVNDIAIVASTGIDALEDGSIRVTLLLAIPRLAGASSSSASGGQSVPEATAGWIVSGEGKSIMHAFDNLQTKLSRKIFFSHNRIIVIGEKLARQGTFPIIDFFIRDRQSQLKSFVVITKEEAKNILQYKPKFEKLASEVIQGELRVNPVPDIQLGRYLTMLTDQGQEAFAPQIAIVPVQGEKNENLLISKGAAVFKGDKLIGWLDKTETMALLWVRNEAKEGLVTVSIPPELGGGKMSGKFNHVRSRVSSVPRKDHTKMNVSLSATLDISEDTSKLDLQSPGDRNKLNALFAEEVKQSVEELCRKVQKEFRSDIFGFGQQIFRQDPQGWETLYAKQWETMYPELEVEVRATVQLVQTGLLGNGSVKEDMQ